jgi:hypothetical protein
MALTCTPKANRNIMTRDAAQWLVQKPNEKRSHLDSGGNAAPKTARNSMS